MNNMIFFIPFLYFYYTRLKNFFNLLSWCCIYIVPVVLLLYLENKQLFFSFSGTSCVLLSIASIYNFYEIGYIQNDTETVKKEQIPTKRLSNDMLDYYSTHKLLIYLSRSLLGLFLIGCLFFQGISIYGGALFVSSMVCIILVYQLYNYCRGHINMFLYFVLVSLRYCSVLLLFPENLSWNIIVLALMIFPIVKTTEFRSTKPVSITTNIYFRKYILNFDKNRLPGYRVVAYIILFLIACLFYQLDFFNAAYVAVIFYMFLFRTALFLLLKCNLITKN